MWTNRGPAIGHRGALSGTRGALSGTRGALSGTRGAPNGQRGAPEQAKKGPANGQRRAPHRVKREGWLIGCRGTPQIGKEEPCKLDMREQTVVANVGPFLAQLQGPYLPSWGPSLLIYKAPICLIGALLFPVGATVCRDQNF